MNRESATARHGAGRRDIEVRRALPTGPRLARRDARCAKTSKPNRRESSAREAIERRASHQRAGYPKRASQPALGRHRSRSPSRTRGAAEGDTARARTCQEAEIQARRKSSRRASIQQDAIVTDARIANEEEPERRRIESTRQSWTKPEIAAGKAMRRRGVAQTSVIQRRADRSRRAAPARSRSSRSRD